MVITDVVRNHGASVDRSTPVMRYLAALLLLMSSLVPSLSWAGDAARTRYPLVLVHGFTGFERILGVEYFFRIPEALRREGATVYIARVNPAQTTEYRGEELLQQLQQWAARDGVRKFHLMGHSHGGPPCVMPPTWPRTWWPAPARSRAPTWARPWPTQAAS